MKPVVATAVSGLIVLAAQARPASACTFLPPSIADIAVPFENKTVPRNATLVAPGMPYGSQPTVLTGPDGTTYDNAFLPADENQPAQIDFLLDPGAWRLWVLGSDAFRGGDVEREVSFTVADVIDDVPPPPLEVTFVRETIGTVFPDSCQSQWPTTRLLATLDQATDFDDVALVGDGDFFRVADLEPFNIGNETTTDFDLFAVDFAGNRSATTTAVEVNGCGCSSGDAPTFLGGLGLLTLLRRRRRG